MTTPQKPETAQRQERKITERGWYQLRNGQFVEVVYINKYGALTVALHDHETRTFHYFNDGTRSAYPTIGECIERKCQKPTVKQLEKQMEKP